jgi:hypothetical protein
MTDGDGRREKRMYEAPKVKVISLRPEEAVLGHCKNNSSAGPVSGSCLTTSCNVQGS